MIWRVTGRKGVTYDSSMDCGGLDRRRRDTCVLVGEVTAVTIEEYSQILANKANMKPTGNLRRQAPVLPIEQSPAKVSKTPMAPPLVLKKAVSSKPAAKPNKFNAKKTVVNGIVFDSKKEADRWTHLSLLQRAGGITGLRRQVSLAVDINGKRICRYVADFCYFEQGREVVEDCKSTYTAKLPVYVLKKKLVLAVLGIAIRESL